MDERVFAQSPFSYWIATTPFTDYCPIKENIKVDAAIIGGGITGITLGFLLKREGLKVAVIEAKRIGGGATGHTTAKITSQHHLIYSNLIKHLGRERAQQYALANEYAIGFIENLVREKGIDCDFSKEKAYVYTSSEKYIPEITDEVDAALSLGINARFLEKLPLPLDIKGAECFKGQARFHPRKYILALAEEIPGEGSFIFEKSPAVEFQEGLPSRVTTAQGFSVTADFTIIATRFPVFDKKGFYFARLKPERSYALGIKVKDKFPGGMYISAESPSRSLRFTPNDGDDLIIVAGENHRTGGGDGTNKPYRKLIVFAHKLYEVRDISYRWSTQDYETLDKVPYIGRITSKRSNTFIATGFYKWGMSNGTVAGLLLRDLILDKDNPWAEVYDPSRFEADPMVKKFVTANFEVARQFIGDKLKPVSKEINLLPGEAKKVKYGGEKIGLYKDEEGKIHAVKVICSHLGCDLAWNAAELSWDCPCHGSRFDFKGKVIENPAISPLETVDIEQD